MRNVTLRMALPALGFGRVPFLSVTRVLADNVSPPTIWGSGRGVPVPPVMVSAPHPPQATCTLRPPPEDRGSVVPVHPQDLLRVDRLVSVTPPEMGIWGAGGPQDVTPICPQDCGNTWCQELSCRLGRLERGGGASVQLLRSIHTEFFHGVRRGRRATPPKTCGCQTQPEPQLSPPGEVQERAGGQQRLAGRPGQPRAGAGGGGAAQGGGDPPDP